MGGQDSAIRDSGTRWAFVPCETVSDARRWVARSNAGYTRYVLPVWDEWELL